MPYLTHDDVQIYYEVHGEGQPLVMLNGIMMSTLSWERFIPELSEHHQVILMDFVDQGKSTQVAGDYTLERQVEVVLAVVAHLKLLRFNLFGISYGGEVAQHFALKYPDLIDKLLLFNTTAYTNPWLADIGRGWVMAAEARDAQLFYHATIPIVYSPNFYTKEVAWMNERKHILFEVFTNDFLDGMIRLINSAENHDARAELPKLSEIPTLVVASDNDFITPPADQRLIHEQIKGSEFVLLEDCGHASMYEKPEQFTRLILQFLKG